MLGQEPDPAPGEEGAAQAWTGQGWTHCPPGSQEGILTLSTISLTVAASDSK
jgi:hypothetical protein